MPVNYNRGVCLQVMSTCLSGCRVTWRPMTHSCQQARGLLAPHSSILFWFEHLHVCFHAVYERAMNLICAHLWPSKLHVGPKQSPRNKSYGNPKSALGFRQTEHCSGTKYLTKSHNIFKYVFAQLVKNTFWVRGTRGFSTVSLTRIFHWT